MVSIHGAIVRRNIEVDVGFLRRGVVSCDAHLQGGLWLLLLSDGRCGARLFLFIVAAACAERHTCQEQGGKGVESLFHKIV